MHVWPPALQIFGWLAGQRQHWGFWYGLFWQIAVLATAWANNSAKGSWGKTQFVCLIKAKELTRRHLHAYPWLIACMYLSQKQSSSLSSLYHHHHHHAKSCMGQGDVARNQDVIAPDGGASSIPVLFALHPSWPRNWQYLLNSCIHAIHKA